jgi:glycosyltransferase involved in cell wall biosynthesis
MRIGLSTTTCEPELTQGKIDGIGTYTKNIYQELIKQGQQVTPFFYPKKIGQKVNSFLPTSKRFKLPYASSAILSMASPYPIYNTPEIDIYHATDNMLPRFKRIPIVATIHDTLLLEHPEWHSTYLTHLKKFVRKKTLNWAKHFITISHAMVKELVEIGGIKPEKISVIYNGISPWWLESVSNSDKAAVLAKYNLPEKFLLFTATLQAKKNLPRLVEAYLQLPIDIQEAYPLIVVGRAGWGAEDSLVAIRELTEKKRGLWLNYVTSQELRILFQCATLYLHPSLHEGFGLTVLEAFASKTPVLTSNVAALPEIAAGAAYLVDPYSIDSIALGIQTLLTSSNLREQMIPKGLLRVQDFSWDKCAEQTLKVYQSLV